MEVQPDNQQTVRHKGYNQHTATQKAPVNRNIWGWTPQPHGTRPERRLSEHLVGTLGSVKLCVHIQRRHVSLVVFSGEDLELQLVLYKVKNRLPFSSREFDAISWCSQRSQHIVHIYNSKEFKKSSKELLCLRNLYNSSITYPKISLIYPVILKTSKNYDWLRKQFTKSCGYLHSYNEILKYIQIIDCPVNVMVVTQLEA